MVSIKQVLYRDGLAANIDSGAWEKLDEAQRIDEFDHHFAWWISNGAGTDITVGRMWASRDGKGRAKYPMVICAQCRGVGFDWALNTALPLIVETEIRCKGASTAQEVIGIIDGLRTALRAKVGSNVQPISLDPRAVSTLASALGHPASPSFARSIYAIDRECAMFAIPTTGSRWGSAAAPATADARTALTLRLPIPTSQELQASLCIQQWLTVLLGRLDPATPMLLLKPRNGAWTDALIGEPGAAQAYALRAGQQAMPLISDVPYTLDAPFLQEVERLVSDSRSMNPITIDPLKRRALSAPGGRLRSHGVSGVIGSLAPWLVAAAAGLSSGLVGVESVAFGAQPDPAPTAQDSGAQQAEPATNTAPTREDSRDRYNQLLRELKATVERPGISDDTARTAAQSFINAASELPGGIVYLRQTDELLTGLRRIIAQPGTGRGADADATRAGPGTIPAVTPAALMDGRVRFTLPGGRSGDESFIEFARVQPSGPYSNVWISTTEVSARLFNDTVTSLGSWEQIRKIMHTFGLEEDERLGPRVWRWTFGKKPGSTLPVINGIAPSMHWLVRSDGPGASEVYAKDVNPGQPSIEMPMQHISPDASIYAASLLGCRLPTADEWRAAQRTYAANLPQQSFNLRDRTWARQQQYAEAQTEAGKRVWAADAGSFVWIDAPLAPKTPKSTQIVESDDGVLWFLPVGVSAGESNTGGGGSGGAGVSVASATTSAPIVKHLVGNVAEWVWNGPDVGAGRDAATIQKAIEASADKIGVIGASALSSPGVPPETFQQALLGEAREGYADVGFRLAFTVGPAIGVSVADRVNALLTPLPTLNQTP